MHQIWMMARCFTPFRWAPVPIRAQPSFVPLAVGGKGGGLGYGEGGCGYVSPPKGSSITDIYIPNICNDTRGH